MQLKLDTAEVFVPDRLPTEAALTRTTHMAVGAHQDDLEIMSFAGILECFQQTDLWYTGVIVTNGAGSPRDDVYAEYTGEAMREVRFQEQRKAAIVGEYGAAVLLDYPSARIKNPGEQSPVEDLMTLVSLAQPAVIYTHNLADKHDTHVGVTMKLIAALRALPPASRPEKLLGCEVWRDLDWMCDDDKVGMDVSAHENLQAALVGVFDSQVCGGKRYDLATLGRRRAHATYFQSHAVDEALGLNFAMDLTPLITTRTDMDPADFVQEHIDRFAQEVRARMGKMA
ncbi:MAG: PIG-L deacetylase family protein [Candidatus Hydrogenedentota bacterium]